MILGKFEKQPVEVEIYSIQFVEDMSSNDNVSSCWQIIARSTAAKWDGTYQTASYTATSADSGRIIVTDHDVVLPSPADGLVLYVANRSQSTSIMVGAFTVPARGAVIVSSSSTAWSIEASTNSVLIDAPGDQRVRTWVHGGKHGSTYTVQVTVTTSDDERVLQDEFVVKVKDR